MREEIRERRYKLPNGATAKEEVQERNMKGDDKNGVQFLLCAL